MNWQLEGDHPSLDFHHHSTFGIEISSSATLWQQMNFFRGYGWNKRASSHIPKEKLFFPPPPLCHRVREGEHNNKAVG